MDFALTSDQRLFQDSLSGTLRRVLPLSKVRAFAEGDELQARDAWTELARLGLSGVLIGAEHGGLGLSLLDAALSQEILGANLAPVPFIGSSVLTPLALRLAGATAQRDSWLPGLAAGAATAGAAISEMIAGARRGWRRGPRQQAVWQSDVRDRRRRRGYSPSGGP